MGKRRKRILCIAVAAALCACLGPAPATASYEPYICDATAIFYACMADLEHEFTQLDESDGTHFCKAFRDRSTYAGYGWDAAYTLILEGEGDEYEGRMTALTYDAALERTFAQGKTDPVLKDAYEIFLAAAATQFSDSSDADRFESLYGSSRMWQVLGRAWSEDFDPSQLSARIGGWNIDVDVAYGDNEMHFYFFMSR